MYIFPLINYMTEYDNTSVPEIASKSSYMAKDSKKHALIIGFLLIPLIYAFVLRFDAASLRSWALQLREPWREDDASLEQYTEIEMDANIRRLKLQQLLKGKSQEDLIQNGIGCISTSYTDMCVTTSAVAISITTSNTTNVYLTGGQILPSDTNNITILPYPRKIDVPAMVRTSPVNFLQTDSTTQQPACDVNHVVPAMIFSMGGFAGNFFHDINDVLIPLFLTTSTLRPSLRIILTDYEPWWPQKYHRVLSAISAYDIITVPTIEAPGKVHCFPGAIVGLTYHGHLACNKTEAPGNLTTIDFLRFLHSSLFLKANDSTETVLTQKDQPLMVLISRRNSRILLNEEEVINLAKEVGFRVEVATPEAMSKLQSISELVNRCHVLLGVHGAGMTNMVFLRPGAVLIQVVPWGLDWVSKAYYQRPAQEMGLKYVQYKVDVQESTLIEKYPLDDQVITDPLSIHNQGYKVSKPIYIDGQNVRLNLTRFRGALETAMQLADFKSQ